MSSDPQSIPLIKAFNARLSQLPTCLVVTFLVCFVHVRLCRLYWGYASSPRPVMAVAMAATAAMAAMAAMAATAATAAVATVATAVAARCQCLSAGALQHPLPCRCGPMEAGVLRNTPEQIRGLGGLSDKKQGC